MLAMGAIYLSEIDFGTKAYEAACVLLAQVSHAMTAVVTFAYSKRSTMRQLC